MITTTLTERPGSEGQLPQDGEDLEQILTILQGAEQSLHLLTQSRTYARQHQASEPWSPREHLAWFGYEVSRLLEPSDEQEDVAARYQRASAILLIMAQLAEVGIPTSAAPLRQRNVVPTPYPPPSGQKARSGLSPREEQVLALVRQGYRDKEIATHLAIRVSTVNQHVRNVFGKLGARNRIEALNAYDRLLPQTEEKDQHEQASRLAQTGPIETSPESGECG